MKNHNPSGGRLRFASFGQRISGLMIFALFGYLIWLALTGRFDDQVNRVANWLHSMFNAIAR